jgi:hypothetical protein
VCRLKNKTLSSPENPGGFLFYRADVEIIYHNQEMGGYYRIIGE